MTANNPNEFARHKVYVPGAPTHEAEALAALARVLARQAVREALPPQSSPDTLGFNNLESVEGDR